MKALCQYWDALVAIKKPWNLYEIKSPRFSALSSLTFDQVHSTISGQYRCNRRGGFTISQRNIIKGILVRVFPSKIDEFEQWVEKWAQDDPDMALKISIRFCPKQPGKQFFLGDSRKN